MIKKFMVFVVIVLIIAGAAAGYVWTNKETLIRERIHQGLEQASGVDVIMDRVMLNKDCNRIQIRDLRFLSPAGFESEYVAVIKDVAMSFDPVPLLLGRWEIKKIAARVEEVWFERNRSRAMNIANLAPFRTEVLDRAWTAADAADSGFSLGRLELAFGKVYFSDALATGQMEPLMTDLGNKVEVFDQVTSPDVLFLAPGLKMLVALNQGSLGLPRGKIQQAIASRTQ